MEPLYEIQNGLGAQEHSVKVYYDRVVIKKVKDTVSALGIIKKELEMAGVLTPKYIGIDVPFSEIDSVFFRPATGRLIKNGLIVFYLKGKNKNEVNMLNYSAAANAIKFWGQDNDTAKKIKDYVESRLQ